MIKHSNITYKSGGNLGKVEAEARDNAGKARAVCQVRMQGRQ